MSSDDELVRCFGPILPFVHRFHRRVVLGLHVAPTAGQGELFSLPSPTVADGWARATLVRSSRRYCLAGGAPIQKSNETGTTWLKVWKELINFRD